MFKRKVILAVLVLNVFSIYAHGREENKTREVLINACKFTASASFKAVNFKVDDNDSKTTIYRMVTSDNILLERLESDSSVTLTNKEGRFCWSKGNDGEAINNTIIKLSPQKFANVNRFLRVFFYYNAYNIGTYSIRNVKYNGIPCYRIDIRLPTDDATLAKLAQITLEQLKKERDAVKERSVEIMTFWVGKEKPFIYSCAYYNLYGKKIIAMDWGAVYLAAPIDQTLFKLPEQASIKVADNPEEMHKIMEKYYAPRGPSVFKQVGDNISKLSNGVVNSLDTNFADISSWGSSILLWVAMLCVAIAFGIKVKRYRLAKYEASFLQTRTGKYRAAKRK